MKPHESPKLIAMKSFRLVAAALLALVALAIATPAHAANAPGSSSTKPTIVRIYHQPVTPTSVQGTGLGTVRTYFAPIAVDGKSADGQYLTGTLTTVALGMPGGQEVRSSNLVYVLGGEENQLVVGGISLYAPAGATIAAGQTTIRPVLGGSGAYEGAKGQVFSKNLGDAGWTHVFRITMP